MFSSYFNFLYSMKARFTILLFEILKVSMFVCDYCYYSLQLLSTSLLLVLLAATTYALLESSFLAGCGDEASGRVVLCCALAFSSKFLINCACSQWLNLTIVSWVIVVNLMLMLVSFHRQNQRMSKYSIHQGLSR